MDFGEPTGFVQSELFAEGVQRRLVHTLAFPLGHLPQLGDKLGIQRRVMLFRTSAKGLKC